MEKLIAHKLETPAGVAKMLGYSVVYQLDMLQEPDATQMLRNTLLIDVAACKLLAKHVPEFADAFPNLPAWEARLAASRPSGFEEATIEDGKLCVS
jgi:hypothetical protein